MSSPTRRLPAPAPGRSSSTERSHCGLDPAMTLIRVALPLPLERLFTYRLTADAPVPARGARVVVGFGRRRLVGFAVDATEKAPEGVRLRRVERVVDVEPVLSETEWALAEWMARYYVAPLGLVLRLFYPAGSTGEGEGGRGGDGGPRGLHVQAAVGAEGTRRA